MILLIFFALPLATILLAIVLEKLFHCPILVAITFFAIYLIILFALFAAGIINHLGAGLVAIIIYTILAFITAFIVKLIRIIRERCFNNNDNDNRCPRCRCSQNNCERCRCRCREDSCERCRCQENNCEDSDSDNNDLLRISCRCNNGNNQDLLTINSNCSNYGNDNNNGNSNCRRRNNNENNGTSNNRNFFNWKCNTKSV